MNNNPIDQTIARFLLRDLSINHKADLAAFLLLQGYTKTDVATRLELSKAEIESLLDLANTQTGKLYDLRESIPKHVNPIEVSMAAITARLVYRKLTDAGRYLFCKELIDEGHTPITVCCLLKISMPEFIRLVDAHKAVA